MKKISSLCLILALLLSVLASLPVEAATAVAKGMGVTVDNGDIDWQMVKDAGTVDFAMLQVYDGTAKDGAFEANYANATAAGVPLGASMVLSAKTVNAAKNQANVVIRALKNKPFPYPICVYVGGSTYSSMDKALVTEIASAAMATLEAAKYYAVLYMEYAFSTNYIDTDTLAASHALCIAAGSDNDAWVMRRTSKSARAKGVSGYVSLFNTYLNFPSIMVSAGLNNVSSGSASGANWNGIAWDQRNSAWAWYYYGGGSIYDTACGIVSTCNAINYLHGSFSTTDTAKTFILDWASYANSINGFNPGSASGTYRYVTFGTDVSNPPPLQTRYGSTYNFTMPILWTENWNSANYYNGSYYNNIYVNSQTSLKNYLAGDAVAIAHVPGHFICLADYDPDTDCFLVLDSYPTNARGTLATSGVEWVSAYNLSGGRPSLTVGGFCVLKSTKTVTNTTTTQTNKFPYVSGSNYMLYDGETTYQVGGDDASATNIYLHYDQTQGESSLKMNCTAPTTASGNKGGYASQLFKSSVNLSVYENFGIDIYVPKALTGTHVFKVSFFSNGSEAGYLRINMRDWEAGWHNVAVSASSISGTITAVDALAYTWINTARLSDATYFLVDNVRMFNGALPTPDPAPTPDPTPTPGPEPTPVKLGDVNEDGEVDAKDALMVLKYAVGKEILTDSQLVAAEVMGDSDINAKDALEILKYAVGKIASFPITK